MTRTLVSFLLALLFSVQIAAAQQQNAWIQLESHPNLAVTEQAIRAYGSQVQDVNGFSLGAGWYAVALGPYTPTEAEGRMITLRDQGLIPRDSYVALSSDYQQQFWPVGANYLDRPALEVEGLTEETGQSEETQLAQSEPEPQAQAEPEPEPEPQQQAQAQTETASAEPELVAEPEIPDETPAEARQSEALLSGRERAQLQEWLKWAGFYPGPIDSDIGPGTRAAMRSWQEANGYEPTGIMTTRQRDQLQRQYNAVLEGLDLRLVRDTETGIQIRMPLAMVAFEKYEPPFAHFNSTGRLPEARVLLISQAGDRNTLVGLYDIMQTLQIVPEEGERAISGNSFSLVGRNSRIVSHTEATLQNGEVKGFTLVWPAGDEERRTRLLDEMQTSFERIPGVLDPAVGADAEQRVDLISGLEIRTPKLSRSGFYVDQAGTVVTTLEAVQGCERVTIDEDYKARVIGIDEGLGVAVLRPVDPLAPISVAAFQDIPPRLQSDIAVAGYSYGGVLGAPTLTFGQLTDVRGLNGEEELKRLALNALDGDAGGPVVDSYGAVVGMLLPTTLEGRKLPEGVSFAADAEALLRLLADLGVYPASAARGAEPIPPEALSKRASGMTVLVSCWE